MMLNSLNEPKRVPKKSLKLHLLKPHETVIINSNIPKIIMLKKRERVKFENK